MEQIQALKHYSNCINQSLKLGEEIMNHIRVFREKERYLTFEVHENTILSAPRFALPDDDGRKNLFPEIRLTLFDGGHHHVADASRR